MMKSTFVLARLAWLRILRGRTKWITLVLLLVPVGAAVLGLVFQDADEAWGAAVDLTLRFVVPLAPAIHLANAVGEEIEQRTFTYLWSRPCPRPALLFGKLLAVVPPLIVATAVALIVADLVVHGGQLSPELPRVLLGMTLGTVATGMFVVGAGSLLPKNPMVFVLAYLMVGEQLLSVIPNVRLLSLGHHAREIAGVSWEESSPGSVPESVVLLTLLGAVWLAAGVWRIARREPSVAP